MNKIINIEYKYQDNLLDEVLLILENKTIKLETYADCCSCSWIEKHDKDFEYLIGKFIIEIYQTDKEIGLTDSNVQESDINHICKIILLDEEFTFLVRNSSNGYYDGGLIIINNLLPIKVINIKLNIVIGLPGSGKSFFSKTLNGIIYDDINFTSDDISKIKRDIMNGKNITLVSQTFCNIFRFNSIIKSLSIENINDILTVYCFKPDVKKCFNNIKKRESDDKTIKKFKKDIKSCFTYYKLEDYPNAILLDVYSF